MDQVLARQVSAFLVEYGFATSHGDLLKASDSVNKPVQADFLDALRDFVLGDQATEYNLLVSFLSGDKSKPVDSSRNDDEPSPEVLKKYVGSFLDVSDIKSNQGGAEDEG